MPCPNRLFLHTNLSTMRANGPIIIIDDDEDDRDLIKEAIRKENIDHDIKDFSNGQEAYDFLRTTTERPLIILCDINMPLMNGIELRMKVNQNEALKEKTVPFVYFTTTASPHMIQHAYAMSVQGYFVKPRSMEAYQTLLRRIFDYWEMCRHPNS